MITITDITGQATVIDAKSKWMRSEKSKRTNSNLQGLSLYVSVNYVKNLLQEKWRESSGEKNNNPTDQKCAEF